MLGLAYIAFHSGDFSAAEDHFLNAAERTRRTAAMESEALLDAGRAAFARGEKERARSHFDTARERGTLDMPSAAWIANGLAVIATLDGDREIAEAHYNEAIRRSSRHPRILTNFVRALLAAGRVEQAARAHAGHSSAHWEGDDDQTPERLIRECRQGLHALRERSGAPVAPAGG